MEQRDRAGVVAPLRDATDWRFATPAEQSIEPPTTVRNVLATLRRRKWFVLQAVVLVPLAAATVSLLQQPEYDATASVLLVSGGADGSAGADDGVGSERRVQTEADLARVPSVVVATLRAVPVPGLTVDEFLDRSSATPRASSDLVDFSVADPSPDRARALATAYARQYVANRPAANRATVRAVLVSPATEAERVQPKPLRMIALGAVLGMIVAVAGAYLWDALDTKVRDVREVGRLLGLSLLGTIRDVGRRARGGRIAMLDAPHDAEAEAYRILRANLDFANIDRSARVVLVTGAVDGEGRSTIAANLAAAVALAGRHVVLADTDLRHPVVASLFGLEGRPGLTDVALGHASLSDALVSTPLGPPDAITPKNGSGAGGSLHVLPSGPTPIDSGEFVGTRAVAELVSDLAERADLVILDAPPLLPVGDARTLTTLADALLVVTNLDLLRRPMLHELSRVLAAIPTRVLGFVATGTTADRHDAYGGFYRRGSSARRSERAA
jgi:capsular exopolysaccharide synthesis family protein